MDIVTYVQGKGRHSLDVLLAIFNVTQAKQKHKRTEDVSVGWKDIKERCKQQGKSLSDMAYKKRRDELVQMELIALSPIDQLRNNVKMTRTSMTAASKISEFIQNIQKAAATENEK
jgi:hypothetical protein